MTNTFIRDDGLRRPWGAIIAFLLPALTIYVAELLDPRLKIEIDVTALRGSAAA